jgi:putative oxidoreductase
MRRILYGEHLGIPASVGLLAVRIAVGVALMLHGRPKIENPLGWMGAEGVPGVLQGAAAVAEFIGGAALVVGLLTRPFALLIAITMATAAGMVHISAGHAFVAKPPEPSWELAGVYFAVAVQFLLTGPGRISLDALMFAEPGEASDRATD